MSPTVNNFVHDLVAMAKAMEDLPVVTMERDNALEANNKLSQVVSDREESILRLKAEIEALQAKVRSTEAERDDAEMRFLELDDKAHNAIAMAKAAQISLSQLDGLLNPPKPEPVPTPSAEPEAQHEEQDQATQQAISHIAEHGEGAILQGQSEPLPQTGSQEPSGQSDTSSPSHSLPVTSFEEVPKSDANPPEVLAHSQNEPLSVDDVGYHNEPDVGNDWNAWNAWCERMRARYGTGAWPQRPDNAAPSVA